MDREIYIAGVGMTPFGRHLDKAVWQLASDAVRLALADAGAEMSQIEQAYYGTGTQAALQGQFAVPGQVAFAQRRECLRDGDQRVSNGRTGAAGRCLRHRDRSRRRKNEHRGSRARARDVRRWLGRQSLRGECCPPACVGRRRHRA
jgi:hypothetical protein